MRNVPSSAHLRLFIQSEFVTSPDRAGLEVDPQAPGPGTARVSARSPRGVTMKRCDQLRDAGTKRSCGLPVDVQQVLVVKEEIPWSPSEQDYPELCHIKEEPEEEEEASRFPFTVVMVKNEDEEGEKSNLPASSADRLNRDADGGSNTDKKIPDYSETEVSVDDGEEEEELFSKSLPNNRNNLKEGEETSEGGNTANKPFRCMQCHRLYAHKRSLVKHLKSHSEKMAVKDKNLKANTQQVEKIFSCNVCGQSFNREPHLTTHMRVHTGEKPFSCTECGKSFSQQSNLTTHIRVHTGEKPFSCQVCGKSFGGPGTLNRHMKVHTGEKPFECDFCSKRFNLNTHLKRHLLVHTGEKPFGCDVCEKIFTQQVDLKRHMRIHTGERPYECDTCGKRFNSKSNLKRHTSVHTEPRQIVVGIIVKS